MHKVMIVDDNMTNLIMAKKASEDLYEIFPVSSGKMALESLGKVPYFIEDAKLFRETLPYTNNPMMIKDLPTFQNYLDGQPGFSFVGSEYKVTLSDKIII